MVGGSFWPQWRSPGAMQGSARWCQDALGRLMGRYGCRTSLLSGLWAGRGRHGSSPPFSLARYPFPSSPGAFYERGRVPAGSLVGRWGCRPRGWMPPLTPPQGAGCPCGFVWLPRPTLPPEPAPSSAKDPWGEKCGPSDKGPGTLLAHALGLRFPDASEQPGEAPSPPRCLLQDWEPTPRVMSSPRSQPGPLQAEAARGGGEDGTAPAVWWLLLSLSNQPPCSSAPVAVIRQ